MNDIQAYNALLAANGIHKPVSDYLEEFSAMFYPSLEISFAQELAALCMQNVPCIPHEMLIKYGVLTGSNSGTHTRELLEQYEFVEGCDFIRYVPAKTNSGRGGHNKLGYMLHPDAFEMCLIRAKNTKKYAKYYILLRRCLESYKDYQRLVELAILGKERDILRVENAKTKLELAKLRAESQAPRSGTAMQRRENDVGPQVGCLYFVTFGDCTLFKIGYTYCLRERLQELQIGSPSPLHVHSSVLCLRPALAEKTAHEVFHAKHVHGEWYRTDAGTIDDYVAKVRSEQ